MTEAALLALDLILVAYCCWVVIRVSRKPLVKTSDLGVFSYKEGGEVSAP